MELHDTSKNLLERAACAGGGQCSNVTGKDLAAEAKVSDGDGEEDDGGGYDCGGYGGGRAA